MNICLICNKKFAQKPNTTGKYCSLSCGNKSRKGLLQKSSIIKKDEYVLNNKHCKECNAIIPYNQKENKFCSRSCSASFTNRNRDKSIYIKSSTTLKETILINSNNITNKPKYSKVSFCTVCNNTIPNKIVKTCSKVCKTKWLSLILRGRTGGSTKQFIKVKDYLNNEVTLDSSWELILSKNLDENNIKWTRPSAFLLKSGRKYTPDFYLPDYNIYLDPKAFRKGYVLQIQKIKIFEQEYNTKCLVISSKKLLTWKHIRSLL